MNQPDMFDPDFQRDITRNYHRGNENSVAANKSIRADIKRTICRKVWDFIESRGEFGATCDEAEEVLGLLHQTCSPSFTLMKAMGEGHEPAIFSRELKRKTRSGRMAQVYWTEPGRRP